MKRLSALLLSLCAAVAGAAGTVVVDSLVASVNGEPVTLSDVREAMPRHLDAARREMSAGRDPNALVRAAFTNALREVEDRRLVVQKYWAGQARLPEHAIERAAAERVEKLFGGDLNALQLQLAREGRTYSEWKEELEEYLIVSNMRQLYVDANVRVSPADVMRAWEARRDEFAPKARVHVAMAVFPAGDSEATAAFLARVAAGEPFESLVANPTDAERVLGAGDYGWIDPNSELAPAFASTVLALRDGKTSPPIVVGDHQYVLCRVASEKVPEPTLAGAWDRIEETLLSEASEALFRSWIGHLRERAAIREFIPEGL